ncbi:hypothetical protein [Protofrankia symbiont of Coriaria ruscifolia]|uniref:hypothetical protein n=1 Tax=Protofrankia symbiont of Coriaria ruscifolia TaxID=1306542 RepID=UPI001041566C|nr:hypothetical protein [Protofrankia symbiont of Coriaria ruscifolia]
MHRSFGPGKMIVSALVLALVLVGCDLQGKYHPPLLPIEFTLSGDGSITVNASRQIVTPLGIFSVEASESKKVQAPADGALLVVRRTVLGKARDSLYGIHIADKLRFLLDGTSDMTTEQNVVTLNLGGEVHGIRIQNVQQVKSAPKYAAKKVKKLPPAPKTDPSVSATTGPCQSISATPSRTPSKTPSAVPSRLPSATPPSKALTTPSTPAPDASSTTPCASPGRTPSGTPSGTRSPKGTPFATPSGTPTRTPSRNPSPSPFASP